MEKKSLALVAVLLLVIGCGTHESRRGGAGANTNKGLTWPPRLGKAFPDLALVNEDGDTVRLSTFKGKPILVEYLGMTCPACQAYAGAHEHGAFGKVKPQKGLSSVETYLPRFAGGLRLTDSNFVYVQLILFDMKMKPPSPETLRRWTDHFKLRRGRAWYVLGGTSALTGSAGYRLVPGFALIDRKFLLVADGSGHHPKHDPYRVLMTKLGRLVRRSR